MTATRCPAGGFTLIEMTVTMVLVALLLLSFSLSVVPVTEGMLLARRHTDAAQKAQHAIGRLVREFTSITNVVSGTGSALVYDTVDVNGVTHRRTVSWNAGGPLLLNGIPLSDDVGFFALRYYTAPDGAPQTGWNSSMRLAELILQSQTGGGIIYSNRVYLRNLE